MNPIPKLIVGILLFLIGIYWYAAPLLGHLGLSAMVPDTIGSTFQSFLVVFYGLFGLFLIIFGLVVTWIEIEDIKWDRKEAAVEPAPGPEPAVEKPKRRGRPRKA